MSELAENESVYILSESESESDGETGLTLKNCPKIDFEIENIKDQLKQSISDKEIATERQRLRSMKNESVKAGFGTHFETHFEDIDSYLDIIIEEFSKNEHRSSCKIEIYPVIDQLETVLKIERLAEMRCHIECNEGRDEAKETLDRITVESCLASVMRGHVINYLQYEY